MKFAGGGAQPRQTHRDLRLPAVFQQIFRMGRERDRFFLPATETKKRADPEPAKTSVVTALRAIEPPVEIAFRSGRVQFSVRLAVVGFLVNDEALRAGFDDGNIARGFHWPDFDRD